MTALDEETNATNRTLVVRGTLERVRLRRQSSESNEVVVEVAAVPVRRPAHVARMLALAHHLRNAVERGIVADQAAIARGLGFTRARVSQLIDLTFLAPDLQDVMLALEAVDGVEPMSERQLRRVIAAGTWPQQQAAWAAIATRS